MNNALTSELDLCGRLERIDSRAGSIIGFESRLDPRCLGLAPIMAWLGRQSMVMEHYYRFAPSGSPVHSLLHTVFYATDGIEFEPTKKPDRIATYLTAHAIGVLAGAVASQIASPDTRFNSEQLVSLIRDDKRVRDGIGRQAAVCERVRVLAADAAKQFQQRKAVIEARYSSVRTERALFEHDLAQRSALYGAIVDAAPPDLGEQIRRLSTRVDGVFEVRQAPPVNDHQALMAYYKSVKDRREAARMARQALFERALGFASADIQAEYAALTARIDCRSTQEQELSRQVSALRDEVTERLLESVEACEPGRSRSPRPISPKQGGRRFDQYLNSLVASTSPEGALERDLPRLVATLERCVNGADGGNDRHLALAALALLLSYRINGRPDVDEYFAGIAASAPQCLSAEGRALVDDGTRRPDLDTPHLGAIERMCVEAFLAARVGSAAPILAFTRFATVTVEGRHLAFADCGESTLRNFFNLILYEPTTQTYDWRRLTRLDLAVDARLVEFYRRNDKVADTCAQRLHDAWASVVSSLSPSIEYLLPYNNPVCEIAPPFANMAEVLKALVGCDDVHHICRQLAGVSPLIQRIDVSGFDGAEAGTRTKINSDDVTHAITVHYDGSSIDWEFSRRTFRMAERITAANRARNDRWIQRLLEQLEQKCGTSTALLVLGPVLRAKTIDDVRSSHWFERLTACEALQAMLSARVDWAEDFEAMAIAGVQHAGIVSHPQHRGIVEKLGLSIPPYGGGEDVRNRIAQLIEEKGAVELYTTAARLRGKEYASYAGDLRVRSTLMHLSD